VDVRFWIIARRDAPPVESALRVAGGRTLHSTAEKAEWWMRKSLTDEGTKTYVLAEVEVTATGRTKEVEDGQ